MATEQARGRGAGGTHAAGWALRWHTRIGAPLHAIARPFRRTIWVLSAALAGALGLFAGTAYAYFSSGGSGTGNATVGSLKPLIVSAGVPTTVLLPGHTAGLYLIVTNPNSALTITGISQVSGQITVTGGTGCAPANAAVSVPTQTGLDIPLASGTSIAITIATGADMGTGSFTGCQNATFHVPVKLTVKS